MPKKSLALARGGRGEKIHDDEGRIRINGYLHPDEYHWIITHKFKPGQDVPVKLCDIFKGSMAAWGHVPSRYIDDFGGGWRALGPYVY